MLLDNAVDHWRLRPLVLALHLLDEIELVAVKRGNGRPGH